MNTVKIHGTDALQTTWNINGVYGALLHNCYSWFRSEYFNPANELRAWLELKVNNEELQAIVEDDPSLTVEEFTKCH